MSGIHLYLRIHGENVTWISKPDELTSYLDYHRTEIEQARDVRIVGCVQISASQSATGFPVERRFTLLILKPGGDTAYPANLTEEAALHAEESFAPGP